MSDSFVVASDSQLIALGRLTLYYAFLDETLSHTLVVLNRALDPLAAKTSTAEQALKEASEAHFSRRLSDLTSLCSTFSAHLPNDCAILGELLTEAGDLAKRRNAIVHGWLSFGDGKAWFHHHKSGKQTQYEESGETIRKLSDEIVDWLSRFQRSFSGLFFQYAAE